MKKSLLFLLISFLFTTGFTHAQCAANFSFIINPNPPTVVTFVNGSTGTGNLSFFWQFGDGQTDTATNPSHTYFAPGAYTVMLTINDSLGCTDSVSMTVLINPTPSVIIQYFFDSLNVSCTAPANNFFYFNGVANGYLTTDSVKIEISFGDGADTVFYQTIPNFGFYGQVAHTYLNAGTYTPQLIVTGPDLQADTLAAPTIYITSTCGSVSGIVYEDVNNNCIYDAGDVLLPNISLEIYDGSNYVSWTSSDSAGVYSFNVPVGPTYTIHANSTSGFAGHYTVTCPPSGTITVSSVPSSGNDFGLSCPPGFDLQGSVTGWGFRPGFTSSVCVYVYNQFCNTPSGQIEVVLDPLLTALPDSAGIGYTVSGNTVTLPINSPDLYWSFCIPVVVSTGAQIGDSVCIDLNLTPVTGDSIPGNNNTTSCFGIRNSWDPNDKYAVPTGEGMQGYIRPNTDLTYTIRFQNTGNAEAINIYILDTLDANLDQTSVEVIATSHQMHWSLLTGNILRFNYDNILLPDSNTSEPASHGYVTYRIKQLNNVAHMTQIENSASIYFDFNPPIYTNRTLHTVDEFLSVKPAEGRKISFTAFPNPSNDKCVLNFADARKRIVQVNDITGKIVYSSTSLTNSHQIPTADLKPGHYTIKVVKEDNVFDTTPLIVIH